PWRTLPVEVQELILHGSGRRVLPFSYLNERGKVTLREHSFEGIVPNLERRYRETDSSAVREELAKYISDAGCPACAGSRLRREARHVHIGSAADAPTLHAISRMPLGAARDFFLKLEMSGHKAQVAEKILKEITSRLE